MGTDRRALAARGRSMHQGPSEPADVTVPTLVLAGADDPLAGGPGALADALPRASPRPLHGDPPTAVRDPSFAPATADFLESAD
ncbi:hypothetical protein [Streptomyces sp. CNQ085]|uniref:hypothetical protein n=1 Tax=Streptomyces sp. CNQ085 TaxID=2886944 RepID=UPI001F5068B7|nr:hypothetical protein [Streptomyces sp. CNQ085]MCI0383309.1 hypothetical protein [Streptomyces sp. CNQ085]